MDIDRALAFFSQNRRSVLITIKKDGRPQSSNVLHVVQDGRLVVSVTDARAKTANARRDPRVSLHVSSSDFWSYAVLEGTASFTDVARDPGDAATDATVEYYRAAAGEHPDWDEYRAAMVAEGRLLMTVTPEHAYGSLPS